MLKEYFLAYMSSKHEIRNNNDFDWFDKYIQMKTHKKN